MESRKHAGAADEHADEDDDAAAPCPAGPAPEPDAGAARYRWIEARWEGEERPPALAVVETELRDRDCGDAVSARSSAAAPRCVRACSKAAREPDCAVTSRDTPAPMTERAEGEESRSLLRWASRSASRRRRATGSSRPKVRSSTVKGSRSCSVSTAMPVPPRPDAFAAAVALGTSSASVSAAAVAGESAQELAEAAEAAAAVAAAAVAAAAAVVAAAYAAELTFALSNSRESSTVRRK